MLNTVKGILKITGVLLPLFICLISNAQDFIKDYSTFYGQISKSKSIEYTFNVTVYNRANQLIKSERIHFEKSTMAMYYTTTQLEYYTNPEISLMVFKDAHKVMWSPVKAGDFSEISRPANIAMPDSIFKSVDSILFKGIVNNIKTYELFYSNQYINKVSYSLDVSTGYLKSATYFYKKDSGSNISKSVIQVMYFLSSETDIVIKKNKTDFVITEGDKIKLAPAYNGYSITEISDKLYIE